MHEVQGNIFLSLQIFYSVLRTNKNFIIWRVQQFETPIPSRVEYFTSNIKFLANDILDNWKALKVLLDMLYLPHSIIQFINSFISLTEA